MEPCKTSRKPVIARVYVYFKICRLFREHSDPAVKALQIERFEFIRLQVFLHHVRVRQRVCYRSAGGHYDSSAAVFSLDIVYLVHHERAFRGACALDPPYIFDLRVDRHVLVVVRLVHEKPCDSQFVEIEGGLFTLLSLHKLRVFFVYLL